MSHWDGRRNTAAAAVGSEVTQKKQLCAHCTVSGQPSSSSLKHVMTSDCHRQMATQSIQVWTENGLVFPTLPDRDSISRSSYVEPCVNIIISGHGSPCESMSWSPMYLGGGIPELPIQ